MSSTAVIKVKRKEPEIKDISEAYDLALLRNRLITEKVITKSLLKSRPKSKAASVKKIAKAWELEKRMESIAPFIDAFNYWRKYYVEIFDEWIPKNSGQITCIENIIEFCREKDVDLNLYVGCQFKALEWKKATPSVQTIQSNGREKYNQYIDDVLSDIDQDAHYSEDL